MIGEGEGSREKNCPFSVLSQTRFPLFAAGGKVGQRRGQEFAPVALQVCSLGQDWGVADWGVTEGGAQLHSGLPL